MTDWIERRLPAGDEVFLDHVGFFAPDLDAAGAAFARIGFTVGPRNTHYNADAEGRLVPAGTENRLITPPLGYLEILGAAGDTPLAAQLQAGLARYTGLHLIAFGHADVPAQERRIAAAGIALQPTVRLRRPVDTPDGPRTVAFTVLRARPDAMPEGRVQFCGHETPELVWSPERLRHPNGVDALTELLLVATDPLDAADRLAGFAGRPARREDGAMVLPLDRGRITVADPRQAAALLPGFAAPALPFMAAVALRSAELGSARRVLAANGVAPLADIGDAVCIGPRDGMGAYLVLHSGDGQPLWHRLGAAGVR